MVPVADKQAEFEQFEGLQSIEDDVDELVIDVLEVGYFGTIVDRGLLVFGVAEGDERLVPFELGEELVDGGVDDGDDVDDFLHDLILDEDVAFGFDDLDIEVVVFLFLLHHRILRLQLVPDLRNRVTHPHVVGVHQRLYALQVRHHLIIVLRIQIAET